MVIARSASALRAFIASEASGGLLLMGGAAAALMVANSQLSAAYFATLHAPLGGLDLLHWINDGLMALFFLLVGLEIKRELIEGQLSTWPQRLLPGAAALGGMAAPALVYLAFAGEAAPRGWAIPAATDIAFALGVLALLGSRVPASLKIFLTALAILDDLGAVAIIAVFYTDTLAAIPLAVAGVATLALVALNRFGVARLAPYLLIGAVLWAATLMSGVHATVAGVVLALTIPLRPRREGAGSPLVRLEHGLNPWVAYLVVPLFGFANAGVSLAGVGAATLLSPVPLGIMGGLFVGKQAGVFLSAAALIWLKKARLPEGASWLQLYGLALLCGVGFTMSLFIALLAFSAPDLQAQAKVGILAGSLLAGVAGYLVLRLAPLTRTPPEPS